MITTFIVSNVRLYRDGLAASLVAREGFRILGCGGFNIETFERVCRLGPDTVITLPDGGSMTLEGVALNGLPSMDLDIDSLGPAGDRFPFPGTLDQDSVAGLGDINNDGNDDFATGNASGEFPAAFDGEITVYLGDPNAPGTESFAVARLNPDWNIRPVMISPAPMVSVTPPAWRRV